MLDLQGEPTYWMGIEAIKASQSPEALLASARLGDGHALATALWICSSITSAMLFQQINGLGQQVQQLNDKVKQLEDRLKEQQSCPEQEA